MTTPAVQRPARRRAPARGDRREQAILEGARALLETRPLSQLTIDELAGAAGISRSSFYFYFDSKQAVLGALLDGISEELAADNGPWLDGTAPDEPALRAATAATVALWRTHRGLLRQAWQGDTGDAQLLAWRTGVLERGTARTAARIERARAAGLAPDGPPSALVLARMVHALKNGLLAEHPADGDDAQLTQDLVTATLRLVYGRA